MYKFTQNKRQLASVYRQKTFLKFPNFLRSQILSRSATHEAQSYAKNIRKIFQVKKKL